MHCLDKGSYSQVVPSVGFDANRSFKVGFLYKYGQHLVSGVDLQCASQHRR